MSSTMQEVTNLFNRFTNFMDQNIRGVQIGCYSVAFVGLTIALRKVRPFTRFKRPSDIPNHFIKERRELTGLVTRVEPSGALLMIQHKPLIEIPGVKPSKQLPVKISGVKVSGLGISWLHTVVAGNEVRFVPILKEKDYLQCEVLLLDTTNQKKQRVINLGESLIKIGFGQIEAVDKPLVENSQFLTYYNRLQIAEAYALRKKIGLKYYIKPTKLALSKLAKNLNHLALLSAKKITKVPKLVTI